MSEEGQENYKETLNFFKVSNADPQHSFMQDQIKDFDTRVKEKLKTPGCPKQVVPKLTADQHETLESKVEDLLLSGKDTLNIFTYFLFHLTSQWIHYFVECFCTTNHEGKNSPGNTQVFTCSWWCDHIDQLLIQDRAIHSQSAKR